MPTPHEDRNEHGQAVPSGGDDPVSGLVRAFGESSETFCASRDATRSGYAFGALLIAANASYDAVRRVRDYWHATVYGEPCATDAGEEAVVLDCFEGWSNAAAPLIDRFLLEDDGYESEEWGRFVRNAQEAARVLDDARKRREVERRTLRTDRLAALADKLASARPIQSDVGNAS